MENSAKRFHDLISAEEAELLLDEFEDFGREAPVTSDEKSRILSSVMRKAGLEMNETRTNITVKKNRIKKAVICCFAAAAALTAAGWTMTNGGFERVRKFFGQDISPYADMINKMGKSAENDDIIMSIDGVIADEVQCRVVVSLTSRSKRGEEILEQLDYASHDYYDDCDKLSKKSVGHGSTDEEAHEWYLEQIEKLPPHRDTLYLENAGRTTEDRFTEDMTDEEIMNVGYDDHLPVSIAISTGRNSKYHFYEMFTIEMSDLDRSQPLILHETESGLSVEIDLNGLEKSPTVIDSYRLVSDAPNAFDYVVISPLAIYIRATQNDIDSGRILKDSGELTSVIVNYTDGTSEKLDNICISKSTEWGDDYPEFDTELEKLDHIQEHWDEQIVTDETLEARGEKLFSLDRIASVTIDGVVYTIDIG